LGNIGPDINHASFYSFGVNRYTNKDFSRYDGYQALIKGNIRYSSNVINIPGSMIKAMEDKLKTITCYGGDMFEFIFPYEKGPYSKGYILVIIYSQETWTYFDCAQAWYICTE
jgi:hypothetical protein